MAKRSKSSGRWLQEHFSDPYVKRAQAEGWRSRAVFKLEEVDIHEKMLRSGAICLDLGAAPGAWSQYARRRLGRTGRIVATDILPMEPLEGVQIGERPKKLTETQVAEWEKTWGSSVGRLDMTTVGQTWTKDEKEARTRALTTSAPAPQLVFYRPGAKRTEPLFVKLKLSYRK